jgi:hypothetical protein
MPFGTLRIAKPLAPIAMKKLVNFNILEMKKNYILLLGTLMISISACITTQIVPGSSKGDNAIIIKTNHSAEKAFKQFVQILSSDGFPIENTDKGLGIISTDSKKASKLNASIKINSSIIENEKATIILTGLVTVDATIDLGYGVTTSSGWNKIENTGMNGSVMQVAWTDLYNLAKKYPEAKISFEVR